MVMFCVICFLSFHTFPENWSFSSALIVPVNSQGGSGGPLGLPVGPSGAMMRYQIVDISLFVKVSLQIDMVMCLVIFYLSFGSFLITDHSRPLL